MCVKFHASVLNILCFECTRVFTLISTGKCSVLHKGGSWWGLHDMTHITIHSWTSTEISWKQILQYTALSFLSTALPTHATVQGLSVEWLTLLTLDRRHLGDIQTSQLLASKHQNLLVSWLAPGYGDTFWSGIDTVWYIWFIVIYCCILWNILQY